MCFWNSELPSNMLAKFKKSENEKIIYNSVVLLVAGELHSRKMDFTRAS